MAMIKNSVRVLPLTIRYVIKCQANSHPQMRQVNGMDNYHAMIVYDRETENTCFVTTSEQLVSTQ
jgi:hypothetical protein